MPSVSPACPLPLNSFPFSINQLFQESLQRKMHKLFLFFMISIFFKLILTQRIEKKTFGLPLPSFEAEEPGY